MPLYAFGDLRPRLAEDCFVAPGASVIGDVEIGAGSSIWFGTVVRGDVFPIRIGARVNVQDNSVIHVTTGKHSTVIHDAVTIGHRVILHGCTVEEGALVGMGAIVMDRAVVGARALVGAGTLVPEGFQVPPATLVLGAPAKVIRPLKEEELRFLTYSADHYKELASTYIASLGVGQAFGGPEGAGRM